VTSLEETEYFLTKLCVVITDSTAARKTWMCMTYSYTQKQTNEHTYGVSVRNGRL